MPALPKGVDLLPSGGFRARFTYKGVRYTDSFDTPRQAAAWIVRTRSELAAGTYLDPVTELPPGVAPVPTFATFAAEWLSKRDLKPRTRAEYARLLTHTSALDPLPLDQITRQNVRDWYEAMTTGPTAKRHRYALVRSILATAVDEELIGTNPAKITGATKVKRRPLGDLPTPAQVHQIAAAMPSDKYRVLVLLSAWCGLRFGEATELRRKDILLDTEGSPVAVKVRRGVTHLKGQSVIGPPKSSAGVRDVTIPPHIRADVQEYLQTLSTSPQRLLFPGTRTGEHLKPSSLYRPFYRARAKAGMPNLRWHDLRHFSATTAAQHGATLAELQARLGHSTVTAAMRYQHAARDRDAAIAEAMSQGVVTQLHR